MQDIMASLRNMSFALVNSHFSARSEALHELSEQLLLNAKKLLNI